MSARIWFERHAQTLGGSLGRIVQQPLSTLLTAGVIAVALALPLFLNIFLQSVHAASANWNQAFDVSVYMDKKASQSRVQALAKQLRGRQDVAVVRVVTADEALAEFRAGSGFGTALDALNDNPLPDTLVVTPAVAASTPQALEALKSAIASAPDVQAVQLDAEWVKRMLTAMDIVRRIAWLTSIILGMGVVLVVGNTIRLDILNRRAEIEVMKLVGASDRFARRPFLYTGIWYGLGGGLLALLLVGAAIALLSGPVGRLAGLYGSLFHLQGLSVASATGLLGIAVALGWLGSWFAATRHIRSIDPT